jgi:hypothetical protein
MRSLARWGWPLALLGEQPECVDDAADTEQDDPEHQVDNQILSSAFFHETAIGGMKIARIISKILMGSY